MAIIDTVIFDLGNVLLRFDWSVTLAKMSDHTGKSKIELTAFMMSTPFVSQFERGEIDGQQFFERVAADLNFTGSRPEFELIWSDIFTPIEPMIALAQSLKGKRRRYILSNTIPPHIEFVRKRFPFFNEMDGEVFSYEAGCMKPDRRIYEFTLQKFDLKPEQAVFIDDLPGNAEAARTVGMAGIHHVSYELTMRELTNLGVLPI